MWSICWYSSLNRRFGTHQYSIMMSMIRTLDLHYLIATNMCACQANGIHRRFWSRITETHLLDWRKPSHHLFCQVHHIGRGQRIETAFAKLFTQSLYQNRVRVTNEQTSKSEMKIDILIPIDIPNTATNSAIHEKWRSEEHTSELQSHLNLVCRLLLEKKKNKKII